MVINDINAQDDVVASRWRNDDVVIAFALRLYKTMDNRDNKYQVTSHEC